MDEHGDTHTDGPAAERGFGPAGNRTKFQWIMEAGWKGLCPRCGRGRMFRSWLKISERCEACGLDYRFAAPDDGPAFFSLCLIAFPLVFLVVWLQVRFDPPFWVHLVTSMPVMVLGCVLPLRPLKGWLVASQYVNRAQEAGTEALWSRLHGPAAEPREAPREDR